MARTVEIATRESMGSGQELQTSSRKKPFIVDRLDSDGIILLLGAVQWKTRITWPCLEGVVPFIKDLGGEVPIGGNHDVKGNPGTLDEWLKGCLNRTTAGWVAVVLETVGVVEILDTRPQRVRLTEGWR